MSPQNLQEVASFTYLADAQTIQIMLDQSEIESEIYGAEIVNAHAFLSNAVGGVKIMVSDADYKKQNRSLMNI